MSQALYRKYRSKKLSEIVGQEHITRTLENALKTGKISHAYLFTGPRGTGKTSIARILAHEINQLPYTDESAHLDIIEIDAASNRRIDEIRDLREKVHIAPTSAKYKVYIIDEVHMLTREAFNALLKTLEEPPAHVVFILATTELHKLPETIISRTQRFTFKLIDEEKITGHLREIAKAEGMDVDDGALKLFAVHGRGSFRDSISLLDQVGGSSKKITKSEAEKLVGHATNDHVDSLLEAALSGTPGDIVNSLDQLVADGVSAAQSAKQLSAALRLRIIDGHFSQAITGLLADLLKVAASPEPAGELEVALFRANLAANPGTDIKPAVEFKPQPETPKDNSKTSPKKPKPEADVSPVTAQPEVQPAAEEETSEIAEVVQTASGEIAAWWGDVLSHIKSVNNTLYGILRMAEPRIDGETLHLSFGFGFHKKRADDPPTQAKIHEAIEKVTGRAFVINSIHDKNMTKQAQNVALATPAPVAAEQKQVAGPDISSVTNIFGGGEVLES